MPFSQFFHSTLSGNFYCLCQYISPPAWHIQSPGAHIHKDVFFSLQWLAYSPHFAAKAPELHKTSNRTQPKPNYPWGGLLQHIIGKHRTSVSGPFNMSRDLQNCLKEIQYNVVANRRHTFIFHKIFQGLPFHVIWDVAHEHPVSFVHVSIGFKAPASASFLGSLLPAGVRFMFGFTIYFSVGEHLRGS